VRGCSRRLRIVRLGPLTPTLSPLTQGEGERSRMSERELRDRVEALYDELKQVRA
jgi:hypothetical protein